MLIKDDRFLKFSWFLQFQMSEFTDEQVREILTEHKELELGVYQLADHNIPDDLDEEYHQFIRWTIEDLQEGRHFSEYGVCDNYHQVLEKYPFLKEDSKQYVVTVCSVKKCHQSPSGGWRWHKWGEYIGTQNPQHEYLYDEDHIEEVFCYHIYKRKEQFTYEVK